MRHLIYIFIAFIFLVSCDCKQNIKGFILDRTTKEPIKNVTIFNKNKTLNKTQSNEKGYFELSNISGGKICPPMTIVVEHKDYEIIETEIESGRQKEILLTRIIALNLDTLTYKQAMNNIRSIFEDFKTNEEGIESEKNKTLMTKSLNSLKSVTDKNDLELLINVWNYYDPTDYSCRSVIFKILSRSKTISVKAVRDRMKNKMNWESSDLSETEFKNLLTQLENSN